MRAALKRVVSGAPVIRHFVAQRDAYRDHVEALQRELDELRAAQGFVPPGHFYSPIPAWGEVERDADRIFDGSQPTVAGVDLRRDEQLALLERFIPFYNELPFEARPVDGLRYHYENPAYSYSDAIFLYCMIRHLEPARVVEVGSGYSSCLTLDTNDRSFAGRIETTFIEPYPELLESLLVDDDHERVRILPHRLQDVDLAEFDRLESGDILLVDSTHVSKVGSDVNRMIFDILPRLAPGVHVHFHDVHYPFEYPRVWVEEGRAWTENYLLRAFLQFNASFEIVLMNTYLQQFHRPFFEECMPLCLRNPGGSVWIRRV